MCLYIYIYIYTYIYVHIIYTRLDPSVVPAICGLRKSPSAHSTSPELLLAGQDSEFGTHQEVSPSNGEATDKQHFLITSSCRSRGSSMAAMAAAKVLMNMRARTHGKSPRVHCQSRSTFQTLELRAFERRLTGRTDHADAIRKARLRGFGL